MDAVCVQVPCDSQTHEVLRLQDRDVMLEKLRQTCNGQRDYITRQAEQICNLNKSLQDVTISSQRQVSHCA